MGFSNRGYGVMGVVGGVQNQIDKAWTMKSDMRL